MPLLHKNRTKIIIVSHIALRLVVIAFLFGLWLYNRLKPFVILLISISLYVFQNCFDLLVCIKLVSFNQGSCPNDLFFKRYVKSVLFFFF